MKLQIISPGKVLLDGSDIGAVFDCIKNHPAIPMPDWQRAFHEYEAQRGGTIAKLLQDRDAALAKVTAEQTVAANALEELRASASANLKSLATALEGQREAAAETLNDLKKAHQAQLAVAQKALADVTARLLSARDPAALAAVVADVVKPERQRRREAVQAKLDAAKAELAALGT